MYLSLLFGLELSGLKYFTVLNWIISPTMMLTDLTLCCLFPFLFYHKRGMEFGMLCTVDYRIELVKKWVSNFQPYKIQQSKFNQVRVTQCFQLNEVKMLRNYDFMSIYPKLCNQVRSLDHFVVQNFGDFLCWKYKEVVCFYVSNLLQ